MYKKKFQICKYILFVMEHFYKWGRWFGRFLFSINVKLHVLLILFLQEYESLSTSSLSSISLVNLSANSLKNISLFLQSIPLPTSLHIYVTLLPLVPFSSWPPSPSCKRPVWPSSFPAPSPSSWPWLLPSALPFPRVQADQQTSRQLLAWPLSPSQS